MHDVERWLEQAIAPLSRVGTRLGVQSVFRPGSEVAAQTAIDLLLDQGYWNEIDLETTRARLPQLHDIGQSLIAAQARSIDLVDVAQIASFLDFFLAALPQWQRQVTASGLIPFDDQARDLLAKLSAAVTPGKTHDGYTLHACMHAELAPLRARLSDVQTALHVWQEHAVEALRTLGVAAARSAEFLLARDAQAVLKNDAVEHKIHIIRETPEFLVCTIRYDDDAMALLTQEQEIARAIEIVELHIFDAFADEITDANDALEHAAEWVAALDVLLARRAFVVRYDLRRAEVTQHALFSCEDAIYPPLRDQIGPRYTPLHLAFDTAAVLSGANMGGKTNALRVAALIAACVRRGLPVPARHARAPLFERIVWLGEERFEDAIGLSAFGQEIAAVTAALDDTQQPSFVVLDEVGRTTTPGEGRALLVAILRGFVERGAVVIAATHLERIAVPANAAHFRLVGLNAAALVEKYATRAQLLRHLEDAFDRRFVRIDGEEAHHAQAFDVARALGLPADILQHAHEEYER